MGYAVCVSMREPHKKPLRGSVLVFLKKPQCKGTNARQGMHRNKHYGSASRVPAPDLNEGPLRSLKV